MSPTELAALLAYATAMAFTPGPNTTVAAAPALGEAVRWVGVAYMLWLALRLWSRQAMPVNADDRLAGFDVGFARGVALQFVNGKAWLNALTISATWITVEGQTALRAAQVLPIAAFYGLASNFTYACVGAALRGWLAQGQRLRNFNRTMALVLVATALWVLRA